MFVVILFNGNLGLTRIQTLERLIVSKISPGNSDASTGNFDWFRLLKGQIDWFQNWIEVYRSVSLVFKLVFKKTLKKVFKFLSWNKL